MPDAVPGVLRQDDLDSVRERFGVGEDQVRRDHVISHVLGALSTLGRDSLIFFGGTALSRTHLTDLRLSEDIDLIAHGPRADVAHAIQAAITRGLRRTVGPPQFAPPIAETRHPSPSVLTIRTTSLQIQLLTGDDYPAWPTEVRELEQRYADAPPARMRVLTAPTFAAAKLAAWHDRGAPRDLYDLWAMAERGMVDAEARAIFARFGPLTELGTRLVRPHPHGGGVGGSAGPPRDPAGRARGSGSRSARRGQRDAPSRAQRRDPWRTSVVRNPAVPTLCPHFYEIGPDPAD